MEWLGGASRISRVSANCEFKRIYEWGNNKPVDSGSLYCLLGTFQKTWAHGRTALMNRHSHIRILDGVGHL